MLQVDQPAHFDRNIAQRYPAGTKPVGPGAQIDQVIVPARTVVLSREVETQQFALMKIGLSLEKLLIEGPETRHSAEIFVHLRVDDLDERLRSTRKDSLKEVVAEVQNNISLKEPFQPEVALLAIHFP